MVTKNDQIKSIEVKDLEYLGSHWSGTQWYWDSKSQEYYYTYGQYELNPYKVTNDSDLQNLKKKYPRGEDVFDDSDYNPTLEIKSYGDMGAAVDSTGSSLRFPHDMLIDEGEDFVMFDFYDYRPPFKNRQYNEEVLNQTLSQYNASGYANEYFKDKAYKQILLYMPQDVQDTFAAKWDGKKFGALTTGVLAAAGDPTMRDKLGKLVKNAGDAIGGRGTAEAAAALVTGLAQKITGDEITAGDIFGGISGVARNPNVEVLFQKMELRTFDLTFKMAPYDETDVQNMDGIIKIFKKAMLPQYKLGEGTKVFGMENDALQAGFIQVPKVCAVNFMRGSARNSYLPRYKMCAITDVNVNYTPDGVYATFNRSSPVAVELKISFMETKLVFSEDIEERGF